MNSIADQLWLPSCKRRDEMEKKGLHFFYLQQHETYRWLKSTGGKELKKNV